MSDVLPTFDCFVFVVETDSYAGNFERKMCAYMTGEVGDCDVGSEEAKLFETKNPDYSVFEDIVIRFQDEHGCRRPTTIWGKGCLSVAIFFEQPPIGKDLDFLRQQAREFAKITNPQINIIGFELRKYQVKHIDMGIYKWNSQE